MVICIIIVIVVAVAIVVAIDDDIVIFFAIVIYRRRRCCRFVIVLVTCSTYLLRFLQDTLEASFPIGGLFWMSTGVEGVSNFAQSRSRSMYVAATVAELLIDVK